MSAAMRNESSESSGASSRADLLLWVLVAFGIAVRVWGAFTHPVDQDELYTVLESRDLYHTTLQPGIQSRPLYYLVQHALFWVMPAQEPYTRLLPLCAGAVGLGVVAWFTRRLAGSAAAVVATAAAVFSPWHAYASETARYYGVIFALAMTTYPLLLSAQLDDRAAMWRRAAIPVAIGLLVHPSFALAMAAPVALALVRDGHGGWRWPPRARWVGFVLPCVVAGLVLVTSLVLGARAAGAGNGGARSLAANLRLLPAIVEWATPLLVVAGAAGLWLAARAELPRMSPGTGASGRPWRVAEAALLLAAGSLSTVLFVVGAAAVTATYADYAVGALPGLFVGVGLLSGWMAPRARAWMAVVVAGGMLPGFASHVSDGTRFDYRPAFADAAVLAPQSPLIVWPEAAAEHYARDRERISLNAPTTVLDSVLRARDTVLVVASYKRFGMASADPEAHARWIEQHCVQLREYERARFDVRMYRIRLWTCTRER